VARTLACVIVVFSWLTATEISDAAWWIFEPHGKLWCGNVVSDPLYLELNFLVPFAFVSALGVIRLCIKSRKWPLLCQFSIILFVATLIVLLVVIRYLTLDYGLPIGRIWWLPSLARHWLLGR
jgi:hypothetical protein